MKILLVLVLSLLMVNSVVASNKKHYQYKAIKGVPVTGPNDACGQAIWQLPAPFPADFSFATVGVLNSSAPNTPTFLSPEVCENQQAIMATASNPALNALAGYAEPDPRTQNVPLHQVAVKGGPMGSRLQLPNMGQTAGNPFPPVRVATNVPITLEKWFSAKGRLHIICRGDKAYFKARFRQLIPNGVYSLIGTWKAKIPGTDQYGFVAVAFGGAPALVAADHRGRASIERQLDYCPFNKTADNSELMFVDLGYHMDGGTNGALPSLFNQFDNFIGSDGVPYVSSKPPGVVTSPALGFPITVSAF